MALAFRRGPWFRCRTDFDAEAANRNPDRSVAAHAAGIEKEKLIFVEAIDNYTVRLGLTGWVGTTSSGIIVPRYDDLAAGIQEKTVKTGTETTTDSDPQFPR